jgi:hypothetical protein
VAAGGVVVAARKRTATMDKRSLSQLLDGAAFPAIILAIAVSQTRVGPHRRNTHLQGKGLAEQVRVDERFKQRVKEAQVH